MLFSPAPSTPELLLQLLELASLGATPAEQAVAQLRHNSPAPGVSRRVARGLEALAAEGLIVWSSGPQASYSATPSGLAALAQRGRLPGAATVLFTDIVGSTELIDEYGETGAHERRQRHFALLRRAIAVYGGREVKSLGDGLMVMFADPLAATECAVEMQRSVAADPDQLGLRVGLHTGELLREGDDFFGTTVIVARRLCDNADAGQIIVSDDTRALTEGADRAPIQALGQLALKGLNQPVAAFTLWWSGRGDASKAEQAASARPEPRSLRPARVADPPIAAA